MKRGHEWQSLKKNLNENHIQQRGGWLPMMARPLRVGVGVPQ